jgi:hypothetical protein
MNRPTGPIASVRRAALYVRVSSEEQVQGYSLDASDRAGRLYCEVDGCEVVNTYRDEEGGGVAVSCTVAPRRLARSKLSV